MILSTSTNIGAFLPGGGFNPVTYTITECAAAGYTVLDMNFCEAMNPHSRMHEENWRDYIRELSQCAAQQGVVFRQSHLPYYDVFGDPDPEHRAWMEEMIRRSIEGSALLGVRWCVTHPATRWGGGRAECLAANLRYYTPLIQFAESFGFGIALENDFGEKNGQRFYCAEIGELVELVDAFHSPAVGICYDFGHAHLCGGSHTEKLLQIGSRLKAVHVQDNDGKTDGHRMPGEGNDDWQDAMRGLALIDYQGELTYEIQNEGRSLTNEQKPAMIRRSFAVGQKLLDIYDQIKALKES